MKSYIKQVYDIKKQNVYQLQIDTVKRKIWSTKNEYTNESKELKKIISLKNYFQNSFLLPFSYIWISFHKQNDETRES